MIDNFQPFPCVECGSEVVLSAGIGRTREMQKNEFMNIPEDYLLPTCTVCGEEYFNQEIAEELQKIYEDSKIKT
jgi:predicted nucleic-acid-binding Zn-ribbon protein